MSELAGGSDTILASVIRASLDCIIVVDDQGCVLEFNPAAEACFGHAREAALGRPIVELIIPPAYRAAHAEGFARYLAGGAPRVLGRRVEVEAMRAGGDVFPAELAITEVRVEGRRLFTASLRDLSEHRAAEAELERSREALHQSEKLTALGSLLAGVSHELNNPLAVVVGEAAILKEDAEGTPLAESAARIQRAAERCSRIVQTFLAMARQRRPQRGRTDANALVRAALDLAEYGLRTAGVEVTCELAPDLPPLWADADQLHQVLVNLVINAQQVLQEQPQPRRLTLRTQRAEGGRVAIEVADNGPGVKPEIARRIFDPFFTTKPQGVGTGVGLSFSLGIVEAHGGTLKVVGEGPGAIFRLELPTGAGAPATEEALAPPALTRSAAQPRALVVDDEPDVGGTLARLLAREGYAADVVVSGEEAKRRLGASTYDLVLSDLRMPDVDGPALFAWIEAERPDLRERIGFVTGDTLGPAASGFLARCGRPYMEKPFNRASLAEFLRRLASGAAAEGAP